MSSSPLYETSLLSDAACTEMIYGRATLGLSRCHVNRAQTINPSNTPPRTECAPTGSKLFEIAKAAHPTTAKGFRSMPDGGTGLRTP